MNENERLREVLRRGDPGSGEGGLTAEEAQAMRRTVLSAVPERRKRFRLAPVFFTAAAAVLSCVVGLSLWWAHDQPGQPVPSARPAAPAPQAAPQIQPHSKPPEVAVIAPQEQPRPMRSMRPRNSMKHPSAPDRSVEEVRSEEPRETTTRQVQFSAPGGTRIIWMLTESSQESNNRPSAAEGD